MQRNFENSFYPSIFVSPHFVNLIKRTQDGSPWMKTKVYLGQHSVPTEAKQTPVGSPTTNVFKILPIAFPRMLPVLFEMVA